MPDLRIRSVPARWSIAVGTCVVALLFAADGAGAGGTAADERPLLPIDELIETVLEENIELEQTRLEQAQARAGYESARAGIGPQVELEAQPYAVDQRRLEIRGEPSPQDPAPEPQGRTSRTHSTSGTVRFSQSLPTGGRVSTQGSVETRASRLLAENDLDRTDVEWEIDPSVTLQVTQPVFVNERFIDTRIARALDREAAVGVRSARVAGNRRENALVPAAAELYLVIADLRETIDTLEFSRTVLQRRIEETQDDVEAGVASERQLLQVQLSENRTREALLETREQLRSLERRLRRLTGGVLDPADYRFSRVHELFDLDDGHAAATLERFREEPRESWNVSDNASVRQARIGADEARDAAITADPDRAAEVSLGGRISRRYPDERENPENFGTAIGDLFDADGGFEWNISLGLTVPIFDGGQRERSREADELAVRIAQLGVREAEEQARDELAEILERLEILRERIGILEADRMFEQEQLEDLEALAEIDAAGDIEVQEARVDVRESENALREAQTDLVLTLLEIEAVVGEPVADRLRDLL